MHYVYLKGTYAGVTSFPRKRMLEHTAEGNMQLVAAFNTRQEANALEKELHDIGYEGRHVQTITDEHRKNNALARLGKPHPLSLKTCPHCGKSGRQNMKRYHFNNCKHRRCQIT